jgi:hypothetical protein
LAKIHLVELRKKGSLGTFFSSLGTFFSYGGTFFSSSASDFSSVSSGVSSRESHVLLSGETTRASIRWNDLLRERGGGQAILPVRRIVPRPSQLFVKEFRSLINVARKMGLDKYMSVDLYLVLRA